MNDLLMRYNYEKQYNISQKDGRQFWEKLAKEKSVPADIFPTPL